MESFSGRRDQDLFPTSKGPGRCAHVAASAGSSCGDRYHTHAALGRRPYLGMLIACSTDYP